MEWVLVEVDRPDVGERATKATLTGFPEIMMMMMMDCFINRMKMCKTFATWTGFPEMIFLGILGIVLLGVGTVVVGEVHRGSFHVPSYSRRTQPCASEASVRFIIVPLKPQ